MYFMLTSHGVEGIGHVPISQWRNVLARARRHGSFVGNTPSVYPHDFASYLSRRAGLRKTGVQLYAPPSPARLSDMLAFARRSGRRYRVRWQERGG